MVASFEALDHHVETAVGGLGEERRERLGVQTEGGAKAGFEAKTVSPHEDRGPQTAGHHNVRCGESRDAAVAKGEGADLDQAGQHQRAGLRRLQLAGALARQPLLQDGKTAFDEGCLLYTSPSPRD